jgi:hypothetical protein
MPISTMWHRNDQFTLAEREALYRAAPLVSTWWGVRGVYGSNSQT